MYYVIEAVHWEQGRLAHVRWHGVSAESADQVHHGQPQVVPVVAAAEVCRSAEVRVFVEGSSSQFFRMKACPEGLDCEDGAGGSLAQRLSHLPTFEPQPQT